MSRAHVNLYHHPPEDRGVQTKRPMIDGIRTCQLIAKANCDALAVLQIGARCLFPVSSSYQPPFAPIQLLFWKIPAASPLPKHHVDSDEYTNNRPRKDEGALVREALNETAYGKETPIAMRTKGWDANRFYLIGSPPEWYKPPITTKKDERQQDAWYEIDKVDLTTKDLNIDGMADYTRFYISIESQDVNPLFSTGKWPKPRIFTKPSTFPKIDPKLKKSRKGKAATNRGKKLIRKKRSSLPIPILKMTPTYLSLDPMLLNHPINKQQRLRTRTQTEKQTRSLVRGLSRMRIRVRRKLS
jgi:hypothetical protein